MSLENFNQLKAKFTEQEKHVIAIQSELTKNGNILQALKNELDEMIQRQKNKLAETGELSADEYVELKQKDAGYKARIEYYQALNTELEEKLYQAKDALYLMREKLKQDRGEYLYQQANAMLETLFNDKQAELAQIYGYLAQSKRIEPSYLIGETQQKAVMRYLFEQFEKRINTESKLDEILTLSSPVLADFCPKSPTQKHLESFNQNPKGFAALFQNLQ
ncbi:hypothetical protein A1D29_06170 [Pasteurellaceae bacterium Orientalotternb1]|nr:hypothetical protein A1D29_06170 [Pasteurellaceae bacterium Orientalotternb1]